ncbi:unnamed protein product [Oikopleura dioica]|uniref:Peptidase S1 domain-containing protein n=1 Tax=Oikopleura dioica TaxID=34765 RepID=E4WUZ8_OIKDI|nr:unnamed protein product [Oikopleura dioica]
MISKCEGDSGGGAACMIDGKWTIVGVISHGDSCGKVNRPGIYMETAASINLRWIKLTLRNINAN